MKNDQEIKFCATCGRSLSEEIIPDHEMSSLDKENMINEIKNKAIKATMEAMKPLLDKLEEATKGKASSISGNSFNHEHQIQKLHNHASEKMKMQQLKLEQRMRELQAKVARKV